MNASPEAAQGGGLALVKTGDLIKIDLNKCTVDIMISVTELDKRKKFLPKERFPYPESQTPWQEIFREKVLPFSEGMTIDGASKYQDIARKHIPRDNH